MSILGSAIKGCSPHGREPGTQRKTAKKGIKVVKFFL
jgi:hypothetical protein